ncbi:MAG TPA: GDCCVxC domain-containing (seleno)protein [Pyrinomonadaceae bacterium]|nr:GDCCVxC domain-containing (seleno)protein [Pyrinomonadaceae bacterium]
MESEITISRKSRITCPLCDFQQEEDIPLDACLFFYECVGCRSRLRPLPGDCCVFCSYGTVKCPSRQQPPSLNEQSSAS